MHAVPFALHPFCAQRRKNHSIETVERLFQRSRVKLVIKSEGDAIMASPLQLSKNANEAPRTLVERESRNASAQSQYCYRCAASSNDC